MSQYLIQDATLTAIADSVRAKAGTSDPILVSGLPDAIAAIPTGSGSSNQIERVIATYTFDSVDSKKNTFEIPLSDFGIKDDLSNLAIIVAWVKSWDYNLSIDKWVYTDNEDVVLYQGTSTRGVYDTNTSNKYHPILRLQGNKLTAWMENYNGYANQAFYKIAVFRYKEVQ